VQHLQAVLVHRFRLSKGLNFHVFEKNISIKHVLSRKFFFR
jgi:hypothetical protein